MRNRIFYKLLFIGLILIAFGVPMVVFGRNAAQEPEHRMYLPLAFNVFPPINAAGFVDTFHARAEADLGLWSGDYPVPWNSFTQDEYVTTYSQVWTDIHSYPRKMAANFVAQDDDTSVAIYFSAEAMVNGPGRRMFVRVLIDGETANPANIVLITGIDALEFEARSFIFTDVVDRGLHTVEFQWHVDEGGIGLMRNAAFLIRQSSGHPLAEQPLTFITPESGHNQTNDQPDWVNIPGLNGKVYAQAGDTLVASISAESFVNNGGVLMVRALVDGVPALPGPVVFTRSSRRQSRSMTFGMYNLTGGTHVVSFQWASPDGQQATLGDRTMVLATGQHDNPDQTRTFFVAPVGSSVSTNSTAYSMIPGMQVIGQFPANAEIAVIFSGQSTLPAANNEPTSDLYVRLTIDGQVVEGSEVLLAHSNQITGVQSFVFDAKHTAATSASQVAIRVQWRSGDGQWVFMGNRSMTVLVKPGAVPDLAEPPEIGMGNFGIEPAIGARNVLTVLWDPHREGIPAPTITYLENMLFGSDHSMNDYYQRVSSDRFELQNAGILGPYDSLHEWEVYDGPQTPCDTPVNPPIVYRGGHQRKWAEALEAADKDFDFGAYDANGDGILNPSEELAILIVIPSDSDEGNMRTLNPYCTEEPFIVDNVVIPAISEWYALAQNSNIGNFMLPTHELAHLILLLGDMYNEDFDIATEAGALSLMAETYSDRTHHIDGPSKLALGWVDPQIITQNAAVSFVSLEDVKYSGEVIVLPRLDGGDGKEYYLLENRRDSNNNPHYDEGIVDDGIAVWHVVEDSAANSALPNCFLGVSVAWWNTIDGDNPRRGIRLIRPTAEFSNVNALWDASDYNLLDTGLVCPDDNPRNVLEWADGTPSGYNILNFSPPGQVMSFDVVAP